MLLQFHCPICRAEADADSKFAGDWTACPNCNSRIMIPCAPVGPDTKLGGYRIIKKIGSGGMGSVYLAEQKSMGRLVALKVLPPALTKNKSFIELFRKEILTQGSLSHNNIATAYDAGEDRGIYWLALEYVKGYTLHEMVSHKSSIPEKAALKIAMEVAKGMNYAWTKQGMIHRDIKPSNIMVHEDKGVKILDLGLARSLREIAGQDSFENFVLGTPQYMPPEQLESLAKTDVRSDIYALGSTLYHALSGELPYDEDTVVSMITMKIKEPPPPLKIRNPKISEACVAVISKMMASDPDDRYQNWSDLIRALTPLLPLKGEPVAAKPKPSFWKTSYSITAMILMAALLALVTTSRHPEEPKATSVAPPIVAVVEAPEIRIAKVEQPPPQHAAIRELYEFAMERVDSQPDAWGKNIQLFRRLIHEAEEQAYTKYEVLAKEQLEKLITRRDHAAMQEKTALLKSIQPLLEQQNFSGAIQMIKDHQSPYETHLKDWKEQTIANYHAAHRQTTAQARQLKKQNATAFDTLLLFTAQTIISDRNVKEALDHALKENSSYTNTAQLKPYQALTNLLNQAAKPGRLLAQSFESELGETLDLNLEGLSTELTIDSISNRTITAIRQLDLGSLEVRFSSRQLDASEKARRFGRLKGDLRPLTLALLALDLGSDTSAQNYFSQILHPLGSVLASEWQRITDERNEKVQRNLSNKKEAEAQRAFSILMEWIGLSEKSTSEEHMEACLEIEESSHEDLKILRLFLSRFLSQFAETQLAEEHAKLLTRLKEVSGLQSLPSLIETKKINSIPLEANAD